MLLRMRWLSSFSLIVLLLALGHATEVRAGGQEAGGIHHCVDTRGQPVFTDRSCADMQAVPAPTAPSPSSSAPMVSTFGGAQLAPLAPLPVLCAKSREQLKQQLVDSFAARDANRLAGLMLWNGYGERGVVSSIESLARLMKRPLLDVEIGDGAEPATPEPTDIYDASQPLGDVVAAQPAPPPRRAGDDRLTVETGSDDGGGQPRQTHFAIARQSGCFWLRRLD